MSITKPYHRMIRGFKPGNSDGYSSWAYIRDQEYARTPSHYVRAFLLIQADLQKLFEYIEPSDESVSTYSYRIHELLMRTCIEIEANFKAILSENKFTPDPKKKVNIDVYKKVNKTHHLSSYQVVLPIWNGASRIWKPFEQWKFDKALPWYQAYNASKHDRQEHFKKANLEMLIMSVSGLLLLISSQFGTQDFSAGGDMVRFSGYDYYDMEPAIGSFFRIKFPDDWTDDELYDFDWQRLKLENNRFSKFDYDAL